MGNFLKVMFVAFYSYMLGNFSSAYIISKMIAKEDIRSRGSGNAGTTNMFRTYGYKLGIATLIFDVLKGFIAVLVTRRFFGENYSYFAAVFVVCGHNWPAVLGFRGGKGVATSIGVMFAINWVATLIVFICGILIIIITRFVAVASIAGNIVYPIVIAIMYWQNWPLIITVFILGILGIYSHRSNIKRLLSGQEKKLSFKPGGEKNNG